MAKFQPEERQDVIGTPNALWCMQTSLVLFCTTVWK